MQQQPWPTEFKSNHQRNHKELAGRTVQPQTHRSSSTGGGGGVSGSGGGGVGGGGGGSLYYTYENHRAGAAGQHHAVAAAIPLMTGDVPLSALHKRTISRNASDLAAIADFLRSVPLISQCFCDEFLSNVSRHVFHEHLPSANIVLYQQGDAVVNWYVVLSGTLSEVRHSSDLQTSDVLYAFMMTPENCRHRQDVVRSWVGVGDVVGFEKLPTVLEETGRRNPSASVSVTQRQSSVFTQSSCHLLCWDWHDFQQLLRQYYSKRMSRRQLVSFYQQLEEALSQRSQREEDITNSPAQSNSSWHKEEQWRKRATSDYAREWLNDDSREDRFSSNDTGADYREARDRYHNPREEYHHPPRKRGEESFESQHPPDSPPPPTSEAYTLRRQRHPQQSHEYDDQEEVGMSNQLTTSEQQRYSRQKHRRRPPGTRRNGARERRSEVGEERINPQHHQQQLSHSPPLAPPPPSLAPVTAVPPLHSLEGSVPPSLMPSSLKTAQTKPSDSVELVVNSEKRSSSGPSPTDRTSSASRQATEDSACVRDMAITLYQCLCLDVLGKKAPMKHREVFWDGAQLMQWITSIRSSEDKILLRGVWQVLMDEGLLNSLDSPDNPRSTNSSHVPPIFRNYPGTRYMFSNSVSDAAFGSRPSVEEEAFNSALDTLLKYSSEAEFRVILQRAPSERSPEELDFVYAELMNLKALSHLSGRVKRQLAGVIELEIHRDCAGYVLFRQGDEGTSWYIIRQGAVDVEISGKGVVCTLSVGDDFGKLALINNAPRAATIILKENSCQFLKVSKEVFDRILLDVEANTVRLKEHGRDVLVLTKNDKSSTATQSLSIQAGTLEKILENILDLKVTLERDFDANLRDVSIDAMVRDFIFTFPSFTSTEKVMDALYDEFAAIHLQSSDNAEVSRKRKQRAVITFFAAWIKLIKNHLVEEELIYLLNKCLSALPGSGNARERQAITNLLVDIENGRNQARQAQASAKSRSVGGKCANISVGQTDSVIVDVFFPDKSRQQLSLPANTPVQSIIKMALQKSNFAGVDNPRLCEVKSSGEIVAFRHNDLGVMFRTGKNSALFIADTEKLKELTPLPSQLGIMDSNANYLELVNAEEFAAAFCHYDWEQLGNIAVHELLYATLGRENFDRICPNVDVMSRRFTLVQFWVVSEVVTAQNMHKRATLLRKIIKLAGTLLQMKNLNTFIAIVTGLNHQAVTRLRHTWDKVPSKQQKLFKEFCTLLDPSKSHRVLRQKCQALRPPFIPFMTLLLQDLTAVHEANQTFVEDGLINFEKAQLLGQTIQYFEEARSGHAANFAGPSKRDRNYEDLRNFVDNLSCIEDQRRLSNLSLKLEGKR